MGTETLHDETDLLGRIARGDQRAFSTIYQSYYDKIYKFSFRLLLSEELSEEIVQETMLLIWQGGDKLKEIRNLDAYLKTVAKRKVIALFRRKAIEDRAVKELKAAYSDMHNETEEGILHRESRKILDKGIMLLPSQQRLVYQLCYQDGLKYEEAAEKLHISHGTVQSHMKQALKFLRNHLSNHSDIAALVIVFRLL
ncbi:RNA polymerase sigma factor [Pedobacter insulae]|uniref:RNA polymerase sigma factor n=1 Tax=Pedobacter insulae TaxID=414048 RepID=A0A1I2Z5Y7_9SPHI|nr:RNA polymerase sigma-70 factor [Pedobacter insulae]SFH33272.1 RNA polymerase sigma-70 factor, ECF subfamily [Pedobacter insulae]